MTFEKAMAVCPFHGEDVSGDVGIIQSIGSGYLVGAIDGLGHGKEAAAAAELAEKLLRTNSEKSVSELFQICHAGLKGTRGVAMSLASLNLDEKKMSWAGVGNVEGNIFFPDRREWLFLRNGILGCDLPSIKLATLPLVEGSTLVFSTDGISPTFARDLDLDHPVESIADEILRNFIKGSDDALVVVARCK